MKVAFSHDWLNGMRGGEKCLEALCELYPESPVFTLFLEKGKISDAIATHPIHTSWIQNLPFVRTHYRYYLPLFPWAAESLNTADADVVISSSHCAAKGIRKKAGALHICYCHTPMRYAWGFFDEYFGKKDIVTRSLIKIFMEGLRQWDFAANKNVDHFVANSQCVKNRIKQFYQRNAEVIYPPVDTDFYTPDASEEPKDLYLAVSALVPYKKMRLAIGAFNRLGKRFVVIGDGPEKNALQAMALPNIQFLGWQSDEILRHYYRRAKALVFPGEEDFGIVPLEMQACGRFVIAFAKGGALETVEDGKTGVFFRESSEESLMEAVLRFEKMSLSGDQARQNALRFSRSRFKSEMKSMIEREWAARTGAVG
jgi:glycosyltransferase involved in cell wall biosynthesis